MSFFGEYDDKWSTPGKTLKPEREKLHPIEQQDARAEAMYANPLSELTPKERADRRLAERKRAAELNKAAALGSADEQEHLKARYGETTPERADDGVELKSDFIKGTHDG